MEEFAKQIYFYLISKDLDTLLKEVNYLPYLPVYTGIIFKLSLETY